jgi:hypothetical protein
MHSAKQTQIGIPLPAAGPTSPTPVAVAAPTPRRLPDLSESEEDVTVSYRERLQTNPGIGTHGGHGGAEEPSESRDQMQAFVRAAVSEGVASVLDETQRLFRQLENRLEELERRPAMVVSHAAAPAATYEGQPVVVPPARAPMPAYAAVVAPPVLAAPVVAPHVGVAPAVPAQVVASFSPRPPAFNIPTSDRSMFIDIDSALDGRRRNRRILVSVVVTFVVVFGALFWMLADSYAPHP